MCKQIKLIGEIMVHWNEYSDSLDSLKQIQLEYKILNTEAKGVLYNFKNNCIHPSVADITINQLSSKTINQLSSKIATLEKKQENCLKSIEEYYNNDWFGKIVWFFDASSTETEKKFVNAARNEAVSNINLLKNQLLGTQYTPKAISDYQKFFHSLNSINKDIPGLTQILNQLLLCKNQVLKDLHSDTPPVDTRQHIATLESINIYINMFNQQFKTQIYAELKNVDEITDQDHNAKELVEIDLASAKNAIDSCLHTYANNCGISGPAQIEELAKAASNKNLPREERKETTRIFKEEEATYERAKKLDPFFTDLIRAHESINQKINHLSNYRSDEFNQAEKKEKDTDIIFREKMHNFARSLPRVPHIPILAGLLGNYMSSKTWDLLSMYQKEQLAYAIQNVSHQGETIISLEIEKHLRHFRKERDAYAMGEIPFMN